MTNSPPQQNAMLLSLLNRAMRSMNGADSAQAEKLLAEALALAPHDPNALQLMGVLRRAQNRFEEAEAFYNRSLLQEPNQPQVHHNLGNLLLAQRKNGEAVAAQRRAIRQKPGYVEAYLGVALALSAEGDHDGAVAACRRALQFQPDNLPARQLIAAELIEMRRPEEAEALLRVSLEDQRITPHSAVPLKFNLAISLKEQGRDQEALMLFEALRPHAKRLPHLDNHIGDVLFKLGRYDAAGVAFQKALLSEPENIKLTACLALTASFRGDTAEAQRLAREGTSVLALVVLALCEIAQTRFDAGIEIFRRVLEDDQNPLDEWTFFAVAHAVSELDKQQDRCDDVLSLTLALNERRRQKGAYLEPVRAIIDTRRLRAYFERSSPWEGSPVMQPVPGAPAGHVFILGFMRSGTTLLAAALAGHESVVATDEKDFFSDAAAAFLLDDKGLDSLARLPPDKIARRTAAYWETVRARGFAVQGKVFVEKMPFNALRIPLIARLFPEAKILLALRDPRDVVLSCVRQQFDLTPFSYEFLRLGDCAQFYSEVMALIERYRKILPLNLMDYRYEDVVADYSGTVGRLCDFVGLEWRDTMARFSAASSFVDPLSASSQQVRKDLYATSVGQWRRYQSQLEPIFPILAPWIYKLDYPAL